MNEEKCNSWLKTDYNLHVGETMADKDIGWSVVTKYLDTGEDDDEKEDWQRGLLYCGENQNTGIFRIRRDS